MTLPVSLIVTGHNIQQHQILDPGLRPAKIHIREADPHSREHPAPGPRNNHLRAKLTKLVPQIFVVQVAPDKAERRIRAPFNDPRLFLLFLHFIAVCRV